VEHTEAVDLQSRLSARWKELPEIQRTGTKIVLHNPKEADDLELDINKDGSIDTPFGEIKKKGD